MGGDGGEVEFLATLCALYNALNRELLRKRTFSGGRRSLQRTGGAWITKPFTNWKKATQKMKSHSKSEVHLLSYQLDVEADRARK